MIIRGDCIEQMKLLEPNSVDAIITDPPAGISFMGKEWDTYNNFQEFIYEVMKECFRVLKSGGHCIVWAIPKTSHHTAMGIERAGFEIRDVIHHIFNTGFPKSMNIGKQIDKIQGNEREVIGKERAGSLERKGYVGDMLIRPFKTKTTELDITKGNSKWEGYGTALKPACEHWILARKPLSEKTIVKQVLKNGCGGLDIEGCRIPLIGIEEHNTNAKSGLGKNWTYGHSTIDEISGKDLVRYESSGRFPADVIVQDDSLNDDGFCCLEDSKSRYFDLDIWAERNGIIQIAKPSKREKNNGCEDLEPKAKCEIDKMGGEKDKMGGEKCSMKTGSGNERNVKYLNNHPTVKSIALMSWLVKLISKEGDLVLDPFGGSGTTACACISLKRNFILIEKERDYIEIINNRIKYYLKTSNQRFKRRNERKSLYRITQQQ